MSKTYELSYTAERIDEMLKEVDEHTIYPDATTEEHGLMSDTDKAKLDALQTAQQIDSALNAKVDKVSGKGLSTNDYTDEDKAKVASALQSETDPTVPSWAKQQNKPSYDYSEIGNTPDLSGFITKSVNNLTNYYLKSETYTKAEVAALIAAIQQFHYEIYATLPSSGESNVLYLIGPIGSGSDRYEEYVYANNAFTKIGDTSIDLSDYVTTSALNTALADYTTTSNLTALLAGKQDTISDLSTIRSGAAAGATAVQQVTVGTTTTGTAGSNASVINSGTTTNPILDFNIPRGADGQDAVNPFKGWYDNSSNLPANPVVGDYAYVEDNGTTYIYRCTTNGEWPNTSTEEKDPVDVTFADGQEVTDVHIVNDLTTGGTEDVLSAEQGKVLNQQSIYDVTAHNPNAGINNDGKFASLSALLSDANIDTLIPPAVRCGGMSIRFVQTSDNKYVQFRYMSSSTAAADFTNVANWQDVDDELTSLKKNLGYIKATIDSSVPEGLVYGYSRIAKDLTIKSGDTLVFTATGTADAERILLKANSTNGAIIKDNIVLGEKYSYTANEDIRELWLGFNGNVDIEVLVLTNVALWANIGVTAHDIATKNSELIGYYQTSLVENASTLVYKTVITDLGISQGQPFNFLLTGTHSGDRILLKYNTTSGEKIQDFCEIGTRYYKTAVVDLNSIVLYHNGDINIDLEVDKNIKCQVEKNIASIESLNNSTSALADNVASLNADVFNEKTTLIDTTGAAPTEQYIDFFAVAGTEVTVKVKSLSNQSVTITAVDTLNIKMETIHSGSLTDGQVVTDTFSSTHNIYKIRILASSRGKLEITTINTSLKEELAKTIDDVSDRLSVVEQDISGSEKSEELDVREFDMVNNDTIDIPVSGSAYSLVKFCIDNPNDVAVQVRLYYRKTNEASVDLGLFGASDRNSAEVIYEIPVDFISLRYAVYNSRRRIITLRTELNPYIEDNCFEESVSSNVLDISSLTAGHYMKPDGTEGIDLNRSYTDYIRVREGNVVVLSNDVETLEQVNSTGRILNPRPLYMRFIAAYDYNKNVLPELAPDSSVNHTSYTVPKGVYYIRVSANTSYLTGSGARINLGGIILPYEQYWKGIRPTGVTANSEEIKSMFNFPVTKMPVYLRNIVSYRPLGQLSKGYLCVSDDDGTIGLGTYTLPMIIQKGVPVTFSVMKDSAIFQDGNEQYKTLLLDAVNNHNCTLAQHGGINWTDYNEKQLYDFFEREKLYWDSLEVEVNAAVAPSHYVTKVIEAVSGGYFGVLRCGYEGQNADSTPNYEAIHTSNYACIPRTNIFCLPSLNVREKSLQGWKDTIDWAVENKLLLNVYFHDFDFVETATDYVARRELLEGFLDYAKEHITMVNLEDIPRLV